MFTAYFLDGPWMGNMRLIAEPMPVFLVHFLDDEKLTRYDPAMNPSARVAYHTVIYFLLIVDGRTCHYQIRPPPISLAQIDRVKAWFDQMKRLL